VSLSIASWALLMRLAEALVVSMEQRNKVGLPLLHLI
jgi:hypothetical protein